MMGLLASLYGFPSKVIVWVLSRIVLLWLSVIGEARSLIDALGPDRIVVEQPGQRITITADGVTRELVTR